MNPTEKDDVFKKNVKNIILYSKFEKEEWFKSGRGPAAGRPSADPGPTRGRNRGKTVVTARGRPGAGLQAFLPFFTLH